MRQIIPYNYPWQQTKFCSRISTTYCFQITKVVEKCYAIIIRILGGNPNYLGDIDDNITKKLCGTLTKNAQRPPQSLKADLKGDMKKEEGNILKS